MYITGQPMRNREKLEKKCLSCGNAIPNINVYCNNKCQSEYQRKPLIDEWLNGGNHYIKGGTSVAVWQRRILLEETNHQCSECGWGEVNPYTGKTPLDIDHIDGDAYNNLKENLRVLCPNCHSLKKTFKNTGSRKSTRNYRN
jgi:Zn finger protein HypA/HybF involved in hydrogenase expression